MKKYVIGNWKCHKSSEEGKKWLDSFAAIYRPTSSFEVVIAPTVLSLEAVASYAAELKMEYFSLAAQDISPFPRGSYTGAVSADMVKKYARYVILGHSERRRYFHETGQDLINKITEAADCGLSPIVCVEDVNVLSQLSPIADIECDHLIIAYTPVDALNFKIPESPEKVTEMVARIHSFFPSWPIIYGGALSVGIAEDYLKVEGLSGLFLGSASLDARSFADICAKNVL
ncbi:MAG: triosephosphate isomerase [Desulfobulbaceae bacterium]|nr:triosephosphate isomerase [Desulfobulbaceae bacterium]